MTSALASCSQTAALQSCLREISKTTTACKGKQNALKIVITITSGYTYNFFFSPQIISLLLKIVH